MNEPHNWKPMSPDGEWFNCLNCGAWVARKHGLTYFSYLEMGTYYPMEEAWFPNCNEVIMKMVLE